jgi:hypothetical protein
MIISAEQLAIVSESVKREFDKDLTLRLLRAHPRGAPTPYEDALRFVQESIAGALTLGIRAEQALERFVTASWLVGVPVDRYDPGLRSLLEDRSLAPSYRAIEALRRVEAWGEH